MAEGNQNSVYHILAFTFADRETAGKVAKELKSDAKEAGYKVVVSAVVEVDEKGKTHVHEGGHGSMGTGVGLVGGGLLGLIGGPAGLLVWAVSGAVLGGVAGKYAGRAIPAEDLKRLGDQMQPNTSAILAMVEDKSAEALMNRMEGFHAQVVTLTVGDEVSGEIDQAVASDATGGVAGSVSGTDPLMASASTQPK